MDELSFTLSSPITEEQWDMISDVDFDNTNEITFHTKHGKEVKFVKALPSAQEIIRCKDYKWHNGEINQCSVQICASMRGEDFCSRAERRTDE